MMFVTILANSRHGLSLNTVQALASDASS